MADFITTLRGLLDRQRDGKPASCASVGIFLGNHAEAILRVVEAAKTAQKVLASRWFICDGEDDHNDYDVIDADNALTEALAALDKEI